MQMPVIDKEKTCFFAGHRPYRFAFLPEEEKTFYDTLTANIKATVRSLFLSGCDTFLCGGAVGFDIMCSEAVVELKKEFPSVRLGCMLPFEKHHEEFPSEWRKRFNKILEAADFVDYIAPVYVDCCYHDRKQKMLDNSTYMLTYFDGKGGGTARILAAAQVRKLKITNLYNSPPIPENVTFFVGYDFENSMP